MKCSNNLKQMGIALHAYHDAKGKLPPGGMSDVAPVGTGGGWGSAWTVFITPFIEQNNLYSKFTFTGGSGWGTAATNNVNAAAGIVIPIYLCPSSPGDTTTTGTYTGAALAVSHYVGIAGAVNGLIPGYIESRTNTGSSGTGCCNGGIASGGGTLFPGGSVGLAALTDGTSNTIVVGEQNGFIYTTDGAKNFWNASQANGWQIGGPQTVPPPGEGNGGDIRHMQMTTVRYAINQTKGWTPGGDCGGQGVCQNTGNNIPLNSLHTGGINVLFGDGSIRFLSSSVSIATLAQLATRDDGIPLGSNF
jgi:prepilin-type processing-associated H-X9-DG protein